jgi:mono/diheme cytochrome c family protein
MRKFAMYVTFAVVALAAAAATAQAPAKIGTLQDHVMLMKSNAQANGALNKALGSGNFADARMQVTTLRQNLMTLQTFWTEKKNAEAVKVVKGGLSRLDSLNKMLAAPAPDQVAAQAAAKEFGGMTCGACHKLLREGDAQTGFRFREGATPF